MWGSFDRCAYGGFRKECRWACYCCIGVCLFNGQRMMLQVAKVHRTNLDYLRSAYSEAARRIEVLLSMIL